MSSYYIIILSFAFLLGGFMYMIIDEIDQPFLTLYSNNSKMPAAIDEMTYINLLWKYGFIVLMGALILKYTHKTQVV